MKRKSVLLTAAMLCSTLLILMGCGGGGVSSGGGDAADLISLLPADTNAVMSFNFNKFAQTKYFDEVIKKPSAENTEKNKADFKNYEIFLAETGIDPKKDVHNVVLGFSGSMPNASGSTPVILAKGNFDKGKIESFGKKSVESGEVTESNHNGMTLYSGKSDKDRNFAFSVLKAGLVSLGDPAGVKKAIDSFKAGAGEITNANLKAHIGKLKSDAVFSLVAAFPEEMKKNQGSGMMQFDLTKAEALIAAVDYDGGSWSLSITMISRNEEANNEIVAKLNGLKMMGRGAGTGSRRTGQQYRTLLLSQ